MSRRRQRLGRRAERLVALLLRLRGWSIRARNIRLAGVEVDLVARRGRVDSLVEVKCRRDERALPLDALVSPAQRERLARAAAAWAETQAPGRLVRVDVVEVRWPGRVPRVRWHLDLQT